jgi:hypothetical protein
MLRICSAATHDPRAHKMGMSEVTEWRYSNPPPHRLTVNETSNIGFGRTHKRTQFQHRCHRKQCPTKKLTPGLLVRKRTIPTDRSPLVGKFLMPTFADRGLSRGQRDGSARPLISDSETVAATFLSSRSSVIVMGLSVPRSRHTATQKIW